MKKSGDWVDLKRCAKFGIDFCSGFENTHLTGGGSRTMDGRRGLSVSHKICLRESSRANKVYKQH